MTWGFTKIREPQYRPQIVGFPCNEDPHKPPESTGSKMLPGAGFMGWQASALETSEGSHKTPKNENQHMGGYEKKGP